MLAQFGFLSHSHLWFLKCLDLHIFVNRNVFSVSEDPTLIEENKGIIRLWLTKQNIALAHVESSGPLMDKVGKVKKCSIVLHL